jgi:hypothetical protein
MPAWLLLLVAPCEGDATFGSKQGKPSVMSKMGDLPRKPGQTLHGFGNPEKKPATDAVCEIGCEACGFNWYETEWNDGKPSVHFANNCDCCKGDTNQQAICKVACISKEPVEEFDVSSIVATNNGLVRMGDLGLGDEVFRMGSDSAWTKKNWGQPISWNQWSADAANRKVGEDKLHVITQMDFSDPFFVALTHCRTAMMLEEYNINGNIFAHG